VAPCYQNLDTASLGTVLEKILPTTNLGRSETSLTDGLGRIAAQTLTAPHNLPPQPVATVDGFCLGPDTADNANFQVIAQSVPGDAPPTTPGPGEAVFVMTGGTVPEGAVGVIPREQVSIDSDHIRVHDKHAVKPMAAGGRIKAGKTLLQTGQTIGPAQVAALAEYGIWRLAVVPRPVVDLLAVGSEFGPGGHHNGNGPHLSALIALCGGQPSLLPTAADEQAAISNAVEGCTAPLIITTGGTAKGRFDLTAEAVADAGFSWAIDGFSLRPGQTTRVATRGDQILVSLPGSPGAMGPLFCLLIQPILARLCGKKELPTPVHGRLAATITRPRRVALLSAAKVWLDGTGQLSLIADRNATDGYVLLPQGDEPLTTGTTLPLYPAPDLNWACEAHEAHEAGGA
jgi:molybdopterin molybdotransferase